MDFNIVMEIMGLMIERAAVLAEVLAEVLRVKMVMEEMEEVAYIPLIRMIVMDIFRIGIGFMIIVQVTPR